MDRKTIWGVWMTNHSNFRSLKPSFTIAYESMGSGR